ncbi:hypothetical protein L915_11337 [Phytophthora nicotianae]|uniref:TBC1 domain family member 23 n=1 Tax=Phytophthora nicotianae TaxID=4792 RepID=W2GK99_PHYNI|nr:hypothetical protein L915_11337 [Phytophthora nicotianae]ETL36857.1 hypothetical protein L916_11240 [Phytophthora nicotianae]
MASPSARASSPVSDRHHQQQEALRKILTRRSMRVWASKSSQERSSLAESLLQLFSSGSSASAASSAAEIAQRPITRRPGVEEVKNCVLSSVYPCLPPQCDPLRGEIWQVLLNVYKRNQHGSAAQEFDRMLQRLGKLPRDPLLVDECGDVAEILEPTDLKSRERVQQELEVLLMWFLTTKSVAYSTGMARVVAPFFLLKMPLPTIYDCFYQYCAHFLPHFVVADSLFADSPGLSTVGGGLGSNRGSSSSMEEAFSGQRGALERSSSMDSTSSLAEESKRRADEEEAQTLRRERQQLVEQLLSYHAPQLAHFLNQWCGNEWSVAGKLFAADFLLGHLYQVVPPAAFVYVMDQYLLTGDSLFGLFFVIAALIQREEVLTACTSTEEVQDQIRATFDLKAFADEENVRFLCISASRLRSKTPKTYKCSQREGTADIRCSSRQAIEIAYGSGAGMAAKKVRTQSSSSMNGPPSGGISAPSSNDRKSTAEAAVDMSQWVMKESRSIAGKIFWYHTQTGKTQWEHPAEKHDPPSAYFALPVSVEEVGVQLMGGEKPGDQQAGNGNLRFFVVDCRGLRSSEDLKSGRIPVAYTLDPSVFDSPELIAKSMEAFNPMKSQVHVVLVGHGVGIPPELVTSEDVKTSIRDAVRLDTDCLNQAALFFQKRGFRFVSTLDGGYSSWHAFMRDRAGSSPQELLNHVADQCVYCRYDTILRTGEDPLKKKSKQKKPRRKKAMPTTTSMPVNGGEGDASIVSTSELNRASSTSVGSNGSTSRRQLSLSRNSITSMRSKLSEVSIPKKWGWRRRSSAASASNQNDSGSSSETATVEDGGSDHGSSTDDQEEKNEEVTHEMLRAALEEPEDPNVEGSEAKDSKFVGVFTIDYSEDEDEDNKEPADNNEADKAEVLKNTEHEKVPAIGAVVGPETEPTVSA